MTPRLCNHQYLNKPGNTKMAEEKITMLYVSILISDRSRDPELWATIWNGQAPPSITLHGAYNLGNDRRIFIWEGESTADIQFMDRFNEIGLLETFPAFDRTAGWRTAFSKDINAFRDNRIRNSTNLNLLTEPGKYQDELDSSVDLRTRGMNAPNRHSARAEARKWISEREG